MIARGHPLWAAVAFGAMSGCQGDAPHVAVHSLLSLEAYQLELDGELVAEQLAPDERSAFVEVDESDEPLWLDLYSVSISGEPSPQAFEVSELLGYRSAFDCWVVYVEACVAEPGALCVAAERTVYDGLLRGCIDEAL